jgi:hypothetical protein
MQRLSPSVSFYDPDTPADSPSSLQARRSPRLILILSWFAAHEAHIAKYVAQHRLLFPTSRILLVRCPANHVFFPPGVRSQLLPAMQILKALLLADRDKNDGGAPGLLVHMFSNGGMNSMTLLLAMLREDKHEHVFPRHVMICDSCPGYFHWQRIHRAVAHGLPSWVSPLIHLGIAINWFIGGFLLRRDPPLDRQARGLNDKTLTALQTRRLYLYGTGDEMVDWRDVEDHATRAADTGIDVRKEVFPGCKHVSHARADGERYWRLVKEAWDGEAMD